MAMPFLAVLPLRLPMPGQDMADMLAYWMENSTSLAGRCLSSLDCREDLETIGRLRRDIAQSLGEREREHEQSKFKSEDACEEGSKTIEKMHAYYNYLLECEENGMVQCGVDRGNGNGSGNGFGSDGDESSSNFVALEWKSAVITTGAFKLQTSHSLEWERANLIWNLATLEAYKASKQNLKTKLGWNKASKLLQNAASWLQHLLTLIQEQEKVREQSQSQQQQQQQKYSDMSTTFIRFWQALLLAQAQHCIYESLRCTKRSMHGLAAKLAAAAVLLYNEVESIAQKDENPPAATPPALTQCSDLVQNWAKFARAWGIYMGCKAEYHQSQIDRDKKLWGQELARLDVAYQYAVMCKDLCDDESLSLSSTSLNELRTSVDDTLQLLLDRVDTAERENTEQYQQSIPKRKQLTEIRGQNLVKSEEPLSKLLKPKGTESIFQKKKNTQSAVVGVPKSIHINFSSTTATTESSLSPLLDQKKAVLDQKKKATPVVAAPNLQPYVTVFELEMNKIIFDMANATEEQTESARLALAAVNLPHSLTAYRQEQSGGGLPEDLWQRVYVIQQEHQIVQLKSDLWELRDAADLARTTYQKITSQLDFDIDSDRLFREANAGFEGHDAGEVERSFRQSLTNYHRLLLTAQEGDSVLFQRLEQLDTEPKYNLLQLTKSQLDCLLPGARSTPDPNITVDTQHLSYLLAELSKLFQERDDLLNRIRKELKNYDILGALQSRVDPGTGSDRDYLEATKYAQKAFDSMIYEIKKNMKRQNELLNTILIENEQFMNSRERTSYSQSADSCIIMIEDAIEEIDQLSNHLKEGKDFYNVVIPKLDKLKQQVGDVSARLTVERLEFDDKARRASQELKDAIMAKNLFSGESSSHANSGAASAPAQQRPSTNSNGSSQPNQLGVAAASSHAQISNVDDEKVATLVAMEFDPDKVVAALEKHDNNVDQALNELLSC